MTAMDEVQSARQFWNAEVLAPTHASWMAHPIVRKYINQSITGGPEALWPFDWFESVYPGRRFERGLSIGCGTGALERDLIKRDLCTIVDAFDASPVCLEI